MVMEFLEGRSFHGELAKGPIAAARVVMLMRQLLDALSCGRVSGVVHRDLKAVAEFQCVSCAAHRIKRPDFSYWLLSTICGIQCLPLPPITQYVDRSREPA